MKEENEARSISRRGFIKGSVAAGGLAAIAPLTACGSQQGVSPEDDGGEISWDYEAEVVIVGSGLAGMSAATEAIEAGASVIIVERFAELGGASGDSGKLVAWSSQLNLPQPDPSVPEDSADLLYKDMLAAGENKGDPEMLKILADQSVDGINFLLDRGVAFQNVLKFAEGRQGQGTYAYDLHSGSPVSTLRELYLAAGGKLLTEMTMVDFVKKNDRIVGIIALDADGSKVNFKALKAVIMGTGVWVNDEMMIRKHWPTVPEDVLEAGQYYGNQGVPFGPYTGEAIRAGERIGVGTRQMSTIACEGFYASFEYLKKGVAFAGLTRSPNELHVNLEGQRFIDESKCRGTLAAEVLKQTDHVYLVISDDHLVNGEYKMGYVNDETLDKWVADGDVKRADTFEELAQQIHETWGVPTDALLETIHRYNSYCDDSVDPEFGKPDYFLWKIATPPYYAGPTMSVHPYPTLGGFDSDRDARVRDCDGTVIPGLYAAGLCAGGHLGTDGILGSFQADALVFGRIAGKNAVAETPWA
ncbi:MAG: FAD-dependent oxidoreductase [Coriobacteriales bacterium]|jgi:succinate dehydrogenase/fumarate reductase flavoprotein subunit|nr:FAD-dependent oxidoreductase [Coriobacteriales bacterium]